MSQENVEKLRKGVEGWDRHDAPLWLTYAAPDVEWTPAGPAAVEQAGYWAGDVAGERGDRAAGACRLHE